MLFQFLFILCTCASYPFGRITRRLSSEAGLGNVTLSAVSSDLALGDPFDPRLRVEQRLDATPITEISAYMVNTQALLTLALERWTGIADKSRGWANTLYPDVVIVQRFNNPVQRKILFLALMKILFAFAKRGDFFQSLNTVYWMDRDLGFIQVGKPRASITDHGNETALQTSYRPPGVDWVVIDRSRAALTHAEVYTCFASALVFAAQQRAEDTYTPFVAFPDDWDVSLTFEDVPFSHQQQLSWENICFIIVELADRVSRQRDGGRFAELYGRIRARGVNLSNWKLQRGRPVTVSGSLSNETGSDGVGFASWSVRPSDLESVA